eukprot:1194338-Prorocentrum_minimum.AAC.3
MPLLRASTPTTNCKSSDVRDSPKLGRSEGVDRRGRPRGSIGQNTKSEEHQRHLQGVWYSTPGAQTSKTLVTNVVNTQDSQEQLPCETYGFLGLIQVPYEAPVYNVPRGQAEGANSEGEGCKLRGSSAQCSAVCSAAQRNAGETGWDQQADFQEKGQTQRTQTRPPNLDDRHRGGGVHGGGGTGAEYEEAISGAKGLQLTTPDGLDLHVRKLLAHASVVASAEADVGKGGGLVLLARLHEAVGVVLVGILSMGIDMRRAGNRKQKAGYRREVSG